MLCIKLTLRSSIDSDNIRVELLKYEIRHGAEFKSHYLQYKESIGQFFLLGFYELVKVEQGLLSDFTSVSFNLIPNNKNFQDEKK